MANIKEGQPITVEQTQIAPPPIEKRQPEKIGKSFKGKDILSLEQFDPGSIAHLFSKVPKMRDTGLNSRESHILEGNIVAHVFYEPSTRTRLSFQGAIEQLGGRTLIVENPQAYSSVSKGETFEDTIRTIEAYCDAIVLRHPEVGSAQKAADVAERVPIINAGDGKGEHPTQALLDLYTIYEKFGRLDNLTGLMAGDIKNGRTVHSLLEGLSLYPNNLVYLMAPDILQLDPSALEHFKKRGLKIEEIGDQKDMPIDANFWYWTRVQKERFENEDEYKRVNNQFIVNNQLMKEKASPDMILMHPLPRVGEILPEVDSDPRAVYLENQIRNGMFVRMALMSLVLGRMQ